MKKLNDKDFMSILNILFDIEEESPVLPNTRSIYKRETNRINQGN
jgi:hypothetical protein